MDCIKDLYVRSLELVDHIKDLKVFWTGSRTLGPSGQDQERLGTSGQDLNVLGLFISLSYETCNWWEIIVMLV